MNEEDDLFKEILDEDIIAKDTNEVFTSKMKRFAGESSPWMKFIAIMMMIYGGFQILSMLYMFTSVYYGFGFSTILQIGVSGLYIYLGVLLFRVANEFSSFARSGAGRNLEEALDNNRQFWKISGILLIVTIAIVIISILVVGSWFSRF